MTYNSRLINCLQLSFWLWGLISGIFSPISAQSVYIPLNQDVYHWIERYEIKSGRFNNKLHTHLKPYQRQYVAKMADSTWASLDNLSAQDRFNLEYLRNDNWEWSDSAQNESRKPIFKTIYRKKSDFFHYQDQNFDLHLNPVFYGFVGREQNVSETPYLNSRGLEIRGMIKRKIGFYTYFTDNQATFPTYITDKITALDAVPNEGYYKRTPGRNGVDFLTARGYVTFAAVKDLLHVQFGYDKNQIGNGYRSMILSDFSSNYLFLKLNTNVWKLNYQNLFAQLTAEKLNADGFYPQKFMALHHLSINITKNFNLGVFEAIMFNRGDSSTIRGYELRYMIPLIFYRSIEQQAGSPDNANLGLDFKWNFLNRFSLYGQILIDEFVLSEIRNGDGWRGNKHAAQIGFKYIDFAGINNLDLQAELNLARPYTYSHNFRYAEYSNYNQPLAHPLGANFYEMIGIVRYQPLRRLNLTAKAIYARYGADNGTNTNFGGNIFLNNTVNTQLYGNKIGQGVRTNLMFLDLTATWQIKHNLFVDLKQIVRRLDSEIDARDKNTFYTSVAIRMNIPQRLYEF
ncbi:MAG: hypothetical protein MUE85_04510 [Microscillaceae bacterium]|jgi:hypothetical protein|nr:hypothetical protein [Microscillaceae bacterium]